MFSFLLNNKGNCLQLWTLLGGKFDIVLLDRGSSRELISHTCLALLGIQGAPACWLLGTAETDTRGSKYGPGEDGDFPPQS